MHCNLRPPEVVPVVFHFNYETHTKVEVSQPIRSLGILTLNVLMLIPYI